MGKYLTHSHIQSLIPTSTLYFTLALCWQNTHADKQSVGSGNRSRLKLSRQQCICFNLDQFPNLILYTAAKTLLQTPERRQWGEEGGWRDHIFFAPKPWNDCQITALKANSWSPSCSTDSRKGVFEDLLVFEQIYLFVPNYKQSKHSIIQLANISQNKTELCG